jgi:ubiquinol-cytochrome c reductase cytochrome c subunit
LGPLAVLLTGVVATTPVWPRGPREPSAPAQGAISSEQTVGAQTAFLRDCATCHGADGRGTNEGPTLQGAGRAAVDYELTTGRMPLQHADETPRRRPPAYSPSQIAALVDYVGRLVPGGPDIPAVDPDRGDLAAGGTIYRQQCAACHQWAGQGGALVHQEAPPLTRSTATQIAEAVRTGPGTMPIFSDAAVSDTELNSLVRYVRSLRDPNDRGGEPLWHLGPLAEGAAALAAMALMLAALRVIGSRG